MAKEEYMVEEEYWEESKPETVRAPAKEERAVEVESIEPTVNWLVVAIRAPELSVVTIELIGPVKLEPVLRQVEPIA